MTNERRHSQSPESPEDAITQRSDADASGSTSEDDPQTRDRLDMLRATEAAIQDRYAPIVTAASTTAAPRNQHSDDRADESEPLPFQMPRRTLLSAAAMIAISATVALIYIARPTPQQQGMDAIAFFDTVSKDFTPAIVCDTPESFTEYAAQFMGLYLAISIDDTNIELVGWQVFSGYEAAPDEQSYILLARTDGDERIVVFEPDHMAHRPRRPTTGRYEHRREIEGYTLREVSRSEQPALLDRIRPLD